MKQFVGYFEYFKWIKLNYNKRIFNKNCSFYLHSLSSNYIAYLTQLVNPLNIASAYNAHN